MGVAVAVSPSAFAGIADLTFAPAGATTTTAALGKADVYPITAAGITITVSTSDITDGRRFEFKDETGALNGGAGKVTIAMESGTVDGVTSRAITVPFGGLAAYARGGNLFLL